MATLNDHVCSTATLCRVVGLMAVGLMLVLAGCSSKTDAAKMLNPDPPDKQFAAADALLSKGRWEAAAQKFEDVDRDHPYSPEARRAIVLSAFAYYKASKYPEAIANARRYTTMHPGTKEAPLAHWIIASAYFDEIVGPNRDQTNTRKALEELKTLKARYPESKYAQDADNRIRIAEDSLASSEMEVGRFYQSKKQYLGAIQRFKTVVSEYQTTAQVEEALYRLVECNMALGIVPEAQNAAAVLGHNFPNSPWYKDAYALLQSGGVSPESGGWLSQTFKNFKLPKLSLSGSG
jgi:outer membrane protein assembly factor BamD